MYRGSKLDGTSFLCTSERVVSGGFRTGYTGKTTEVVDVAKQRAVTTWAIKLADKEAQVYAFTGTKPNKTMEETETFYLFPSSTGVLLVEIKGSSTQTITIDRSNSSFVYSGQDLNSFMNKTNIFTGTCRSANN